MPILAGNWKTTAFAFVTAFLNYFAQLGPNLPETPQEWFAACMSAALIAWGLVQKDFNKTNAPDPVVHPKTLPASDVMTAKKALVLLLLPSFLVAGCYTNPRTWVERDGFMARQYHESGHGWTEKGIITMIECDFDDLKDNSFDKMEYCPPMGKRESKTMLAQVTASQSDTIIPAVIHGLAFMAGTLGGAAILGSMIPSSNITQINNSTGSTLFGSTIQGQPIQGLRFGGPLP
jgi:hypothetical protein